MKSTPHATVQNAIVLFQHGKTTREAAHELGISASMAGKIRKDNKENLPEPPKAGAHCKVSALTKRDLARKFDTGELRTLRDGQHYIESVEGRHVHVESVRNYVEEEGLRSYMRQDRPALTRLQKKARFAFAERWRHKDVEWWKNVMFSDETSVSRFGTFGRRFYLKRPRNKTPRPHHKKGTKQGGGGKICLWGCLTYRAPGDLCRLSGYMDAETYVDVLKSYVIRTWKFYELKPKNLIFQQDNASAHTAKLSKAYLAKQKIAVLEWPANSPDLNIIEHVWAYMNRELDRYDTYPETMDDLWERVQVVWENMSLDFIHNLYNSIPHRIEQLYARGGDNTDY
jgi:transposase